MTAVASPSAHSRLERMSGLAILLALAAGFLAANSALGPAYRAIHHMPVHLGLGPLEFREPLIEFINAGLMALFFLLVGLELKRELAEGQLAARGAAALPIFAAAGGMALPGLIYATINAADSTGLRGWAIPMATDTVLALGVLSLLGRRVPSALRIFLTALAIFDDIGAVLVIGVFYAQGLSVVWAGVGLAAALGLFGAGRARWAHPLPYVVLGGLVWVAMGRAGIEPALAGIVLGACVPMRARRPAAASPLRSVERRLHPWVALGVVPLFAFFNAGVRLDAAMLGGLLAPVSLGVILGLVLGKPLGIVGAAWIAERGGWAVRPKGIGWGQLWGVAALAGIGFTMSLFVGALAFPGSNTVEQVRLAVLVGSALAGATGLIILRVARAPRTFVELRSATRGPLADDTGAPSPGRRD